MSEDDQSYDMDFIEIIFSIRMDVDMCEDVNNLKEIKEHV